MAGAPEQNRGLKVVLEGKFLRCTEVEEPVLLLVDDTDGSQALVYTEGPHLPVVDNVIRAWWFAAEGGCGYVIPTSVDLPPSAQPWFAPRGALARMLVVNPILGGATCACGHAVKTVGEWRAHAGLDNSTALMRLINGKLVPGNPVLTAALPVSPQRSVCPQSVARALCGHSNRRR